MRNKAEQAQSEICSGRLKKRPEFLFVAKDGQKWVSDSVVVQIIETDRDEVRFGFTATKKIGNAVIRNRAKRRLRAAADEIIKSETIKSVDIVLIARDKTANIEWNKLVKDMRWCLKRLNALEEKPSL